MQVQLLSDQSGRKEYAVILDRGDEAISRLRVFAQEHSVTSGHFTAIGMFQSAILGSFSIAQKTYEKIPITSSVEVASMIGDIALLNGKPVIHSHAVVGFPDGTTRAGHLLEAHVGITLEVMITVQPTVMRRRFDPEMRVSRIDPSLKNESGE